MLDQIFSFLKFLIDIFSSLPKEKQEETTEAVAGAFDWIFRSFYRDERKKGAV